MHNVVWGCAEILPICWQNSVDRKEKCQLGETSRLALNYQCLNHKKFVSDNEENFFEI